MNDLPASVRRYISEYTPLEHNVRVECDVHSLAYADERVNGDNSFPLQLTVWMTLTFKLPRELDDEYIELMTEGREINPRLRLRIGKPWDNGINIYNYLLQKQKEILQNDPQNSIQYVLFEDPDGIRIEVNFIPGAGLLKEGEEFKSKDDYIRKDGKDIK